MGIQAKKLSVPYILKRLFGFTDQVRTEMLEAVAGGSSDCLGDCLGGAGIESDGDC